MPNSFKYNLSAESNSLKKGNFYIGIGDVDKGPTSSTGFWNGINPPSGGYSVYVNKASGGPSIQVCANDSALITLTNRIASTSYTTIDECFTYFATQTDKVIWGGEVSPVISRGLQSYIDFSSTACYPRGGNKFWNLANSAVGYIQSTSFSLTDGGKMITTGANNGQPNDVGSRISIGTAGNNRDRFGKTDSFTFAFWTKQTGNTSRMFSTGSAGSGTTDNCMWQFWYESGAFYWWDSGGGGTNNIVAYTSSIPNNVWCYITITYSYNEGGEDIARVYLNDSLIGSGRTLTSVHSTIDRYDSALQYTLGGGYYSSCYTSNSPGEFATFQVYDRALSASEVAINYNKTKSRFGL
jgi:hypothetical protein